MEKKEEHPLVKEMLTTEFLKQFKDSKDLNEFMAVTQKLCKRRR